MIHSADPAPLRGPQRGLGVVIPGRVEPAALRAALAAATRWLLAAALAVLSLGSGPVLAGAAEGEQSGCADCHGDPEYLVTNKKLYEYFQQWNDSVHKQEGVTCDDCHGGDPRATDKRRAHGSGVGSADPDSGIYYKAVPETCGQCHDEILEGFRKSHHFQHVVKKGEELQGPTCVTCHGAINVDILNVTSVEQSCARCHNETRANHPEIPERARYLLNRFLSIHRFYRYITTNAEPEEAGAFFRDLDPRLQRLSVTWHTFDIDAAEKETGEVLALLKAKRDEIRNRLSEQREDAKRGDTSRASELR